MKQERTIDDCLSDAAEFEKEALSLLRRGDRHAAIGAKHMAESFMEEALEIEARELSKENQ